MDQTDKVEVVTPNLNGTVKDGVFHPAEPGAPFVKSLKPTTLIEALSKAQSEFETPKKNKKITYGRGDEKRDHWYADLDSIIAATQKPLNKYGIVPFHQLTYQGSSYGLKTTIMHTSGEHLDTFYPLVDPAKVKAQEFGSALTYARRYSLSSLVGLACEDDDDGGNAPDPKGKGNQPPAGSSSAPPKKPAGAQAKKDPHPPVENQDDKRAEALAYLINLDKKKKLGAEYVKAAIKRCVGAVKRADTLTEAELVSVIDFIESQNP